MELKLLRTRVLSEIFALYSIRCSINYYLAKRIVKEAIYSLEKIKVLALKEFRGCHTNNLLLD